MEISLIMVQVKLWLPILDLENFFTDIHKYLRLLEETIILTLAEYGLKATSDGETGVWLDVGTLRAKYVLWVYVPVDGLLCMDLLLMSIPI